MNSSSTLLMPSRILVTKRCALYKCCRLNGRTIHHVLVVIYALLLRSPKICLVSSKRIFEQLKFWFERMARLQFTIVSPRTLSTSSRCLNSLTLDSLHGT